MAYTIVFRQKYGFCFFCCHSVLFGCPYRCAVKRFVNCLDHCVIPCTTCLTSLLDWICPKKILLQISESLESSSLSWLHSKKCSRRPWRKLGIETDERKPVFFTSLAEVILDAILFIFLRATSSRKSSRQYARATRDDTICSKNRNFVPYHRDKARSRAYGLLPLWLLDVFVVHRGVR